MDLMYSVRNSTTRRAFFWNQWTTEIVVVDDCGARVTQQIFTYPKDSLLSEILWNGNDTIAIGQSIRASINTLENVDLSWRLDGVEIAKNTRTLSYLPGDTGLFKLQVFAQGSECPDSATAFVYVYRPTWFAPNAFSPNNDQDNDFWNISCTYCTVEALEIYNRWGQCIYQSETGEAWAGPLPRTGIR